jgi:GTP-binding protein HflX
LRRLEKMYQRRLPPAEIVTPDFARQMTELSHEVGRQIGVLVDRKGHVEHVIIGDATQIVLPALDRSRLGQVALQRSALHSHPPARRGGADARRPDRSGACCGST